MRYRAEPALACLSRSSAVSTVVFIWVYILGPAPLRKPSETARQRATAIDGRKIACMRDVLAQTDFGVDLDIVWDAATSRFPALVGPLPRLLAELDQQARKPRGP